MAPRRRSPPGSIRTSPVEQMDAAAYLALSAALDRELPCAIEGLAEARERAAMAFEDLAAHAITGRVVSNVEQLPSGARRQWNLWRRINRLHENLRATVAMYGEMAYAALDTVTGGRIESVIHCRHDERRREAQRGV